MKLTTIGNIPVPARESPSLQETEQRSHWSEANPGEYLVPAGTTWSQILDYVSGSGSYWPLELYSVGFAMSRGTAVRYAVVHRCVSLICRFNCRFNYFRIWIIICT